MESLCHRRKWCSRLTSWIYLRWSCPPLARNQKPRYFMDWRIWYTRVRWRFNRRSSHRPHWWRRSWVVDILPPWTSWSEFVNFCWQHSKWYLPCLISGWRSGHNNYIGWQGSHITDLSPTQPLTRLNLTQRDASHWERDWFECQVMSGCQSTRGSHHEDNE